MSEDIQKESSSPQPEDARRKGVDGPKPDSKSPPYPKTVFAAGLIIVGCGGCLVLAAGVVLFLSAILGFAPDHLARLVFGGIIWLLLGGFLIWSGLRFVRGSYHTYPYPLALTLFIYPVLYALTDFGFSLWLMVPIFCVVLAVPLLVGVLLWVGWAPYKAWQNAENARQAVAPPKEGGA